MRTAGTSALVLLLLSGADIRAQSRPDFSGAWRPVRVEAGGQSQTVTTTQGDLRIEQTATVLTVFHPPDGSSRSVYKLDGSESRNGDEVAHASWLGRSIVIDSTLGDLKIKMKQVFSLDATGALVLESTAGPPMGDGSATRTICMKVAAQGRGSGAAPAGAGDR